MSEILSPPALAPERFVSISIDDGHLADLRTAELLAKYGLAATFYIPASNAEREVLSQPQIRVIARQFEVGSHTFSHVSLDSIPERRAWMEICDGKIWLEQVLGQEVVSFCYPRGKFNRRLAKMVAQAGFVGARTCLMNLHDFPRDPFLWGVSTQGYSHRFIIHVRHALLQGNFGGISNFVRVYKGTTNWQEHFTRALDYVEMYGGVAHLMLHSWEIEANSEWPKLAMVFKGIAERKALVPSSNGALFRLWRLRHSDGTDFSPSRQSVRGTPN